MRRSRSGLDRLLFELGRELRPLGRRARRRALAEVRDHVLSAVEAESVLGETAEEREQRAVRRFGDAESVAAQLRDARPRRRPTAGPALAGVIAAVAFFALPAGPIAQGLAPRVASAASVPVEPNAVVAARCAAAWNRSANARWHSFARSLGSHRAQIGVVYMGEAENGKMVLTHRACSVKLWLARRRGHWQHAVLVAGRVHGNDVQFGGRAFPRSPKTPLHLRQRTTAQSANSQVRADGTLRYLGSGTP